jgi:hypothetical protein
MPINTGCTIQKILGSDTPNQGRIKINDNFDCVFSAITNAVTNDTYVTGGTYNSLTESIDFSGTTLFPNFSVNVSALLDDTNTFTTGVTLNGTVLEFDRNDLLNAYSVDISSINTDNYVTGGTYNSLTESIDFSGTTLFPNFSVNVSALLDDTNTFTTGGTYNPSNGIATFSNNSGGTFQVSGFLTGMTDFYTTGATLNGTVLEFDRNDLLNAYSVELSGLTSSFTGQSLSQTLSIGNNTGNNDIITDIDDVILSSSGGTLLDLRAGADGSVLLGQPAISYGGKGGADDGGGILILTPNGITLAHDGGSFNDFYFYTEKDNYGQLARYRTGDTAYYGFNLYGDNTYQQYSTGVSIKDNEINSFTSANKNNPAIIIGSKASTINSGITNSVIIGGEGLSATQNNTVYVPNLNIGTIGSGTSVNNLGIDINGNVVSGSTSTKVTITFTPGTVGVPNTLTHNLGTTDIIIQLWDLTTNELINTTINNVTTTQVDVIFGTNPSGNVKAIII